MTSKSTISEWLEEGKNGLHSHMIVVCDTFDYTDYPVYVDNEADILQKIKTYDKKSMQKIMEIYNYSMPLEEQLDSYKAWNIEAC